MQLDLSAATVFNALTTLVIAVIGWMLKSVYADFKQAMGVLAQQSIDIAVLKEQVKTHIESHEDAK